MEKLTVLNKGKVLYVKVFGKEWEPILPEEPKKVVTKAKAKTKKIE